MADAPSDRVVALEERLDDIREELASVQRERDPEAVDGYEFERTTGGRVSLSDLFGDRDDLIVVHNMGRSCPYCTMWADGFEGLRPHLEDRAAFVVSTPDDPGCLRAFAENRGWGFDLVSTRGTTFAADMGFETEDGDPTPGVSTFHRTEDDEVVRVARRSFGPGDEFCATYPLFDLLLDGRGDWRPRLQYESQPSA